MPGGRPAHKHRSLYMELASVKALLHSPGRIKISGENLQGEGILSSGVSGKMILYIVIQFCSWVESFLGRVLICLSCSALTKSRQSESSTWHRTSLRKWVLSASSFTNFSEHRGHTNLPEWLRVMCSLSERRHPQSAGAGNGEKGED